MLTYDLISRTTLSSAAASVTFSSFPSTYVDLVLVCNATAASGNPSLRIRFNGDSGSNYSQTNLQGNGSTASSGRESNVTSAYVSYAGLPAISIAHIIDYSNTTTYKTLLERSNNASLLVATSVNLWRSTNAITSIELAAGSTFPSANLSAGSTFSLFGIAG